MTTYAEALPEIVHTPFKGPWGRKYFGAIGARMDIVLERYRHAVFSRLPLLAATDSLDVIGRSRKLPRGLGESNDDFSLRLKDAWNIWGGDNTPLTGVGGGAASHLGMLEAIKAMGAPTGPDGATIVQQNGRYAQLSSIGGLVLGTLMDCVNRVDLTGTVTARPGWTFDGRDNFYSVFGIVFPEPASFDATAFHAAVEQWRPSKALYIGVWIIDTGVLLGWPATGRTLGTEPDLGGNTIVYLPPPRGDHTRIGYHT